MQVVRGCLVSVWIVFSWCAVVLLAALVGWPGWVLVNCWLLAVCLLFVVYV